MIYFFLKEDKEKMPNRFKENHVQILTTSLNSLSLPGFSLKSEEWGGGGKRKRKEDGVGLVKWLVNNEVA